MHQAIHSAAPLPTTKLPRASPEYATLDTSGNKSLVTLAPYFKYSVIVSKAHEQFFFCPRGEKRPQKNHLGSWTSFE